MKLNSLYRSLAALTLCTVVLPMAAQQSNSLYFMDRIPQVSQLNPANQPKCGFYFGLPGLSSIEVNAGNSAISFNDVLPYNKSLDSTVWFLYDKNTQNNFLSKFKASNFVYGDVRLDLLSFGFRANQNYFTFSISERAEARFNIPHDIPRLFVQLNQSEISATATKESFDFSGMGINATYYHEFAISFSREVNKTFTYGIRGKVLFGMANLSTADSKIYLDSTGYTSWTARSNLKINSSLPGIKVTYKTDGSVDNINSDDNTDMAKTLLNTNNLGLGMDIGVTKKLGDNVYLSASLLDLGYIRWKDNIHQFNQNVTYTFKGLTVSTADSVNTNQALIDTIKSQFKFTDVTSAYTTYLSPKLYAGIHADLTSSFGVAYLARLQLLDKSLRMQNTFSICWNPNGFFNSTISYTIADGMYDNLGAGLSLNFGPLQWYMLCERIPLIYNKDFKTSALIPIYAKNFNLHTGFNFVFGYDRFRKLLKDKPLVEL
jgi:hypothetical protein